MNQYLVQVGWMHLEEEQMGLVCSRDMGTSAYHCPLALAAIRPSLHPVTLQHRPFQMHLHWDTLPRLVLF